MVDDVNLHRELGSISEQLRNIEKTLEAHDRSRSKAYDKIDALNTAVAGLRTEVSDVRKDVKAMKPHVDDWRTIRNRGWGLLAGVCIAGGAVGAKLQPLIDWLGKIFSKGG